MAGTKSLKREWLVSKRSLVWTASAAVLGCLACWALPLLAVGGCAGLASVTSSVHPGLGLVLGSTSFAAGLALAAIASRRAHQRGATCSCSPQAPSAAPLYRSPAVSKDEPIACTADLGNGPLLQEQLDRYRAVFQHLLATERFSGGFRWRFQRRPGLEEELMALAEREHDCCRFFRFELTKAGDHLLWETRAAEEARSVLEEFARLPQRLAQEPRRGRDLTAVKHSASEAGLVFAAEGLEPASRSKTQPTQPSSPRRS